MSNIPNASIKDTLRYVTKISESKGTNILFVTQRLSDFVEMRRAAMLLKQSGYTCIILFCGVGQEKYDNEVIYAMNQSIEKGEIDAKIIKPTKVLRFLQPLLAYILIKLGAVRLLNNILDARISKTKNIKKQPKKLKITPLTIVDKFSNYKILKFLGPLRLYKILSRFFNFKYKFENFVNKIVGAIKGVLKFIRAKLIKLPLMLLFYYVHLKVYKGILKYFGIKLVILPEDIVGHVSPLIIKAARNRKLKIPTLILPYTIANQSEAFQSLKKCEHLNLDFNFSNRFVGFLYPAWVMRQDGYEILRLPPWHIFGHKITRCSPPDPWMMNSGFATLIAVENETMLNYYHQSGIPKKKLRVVGACYDDQLAYFLLNKEKELKTLYKELGINNSKPLLLIGGFPNQLLGDSAPGFDFENIDEAVDFITNLLEPFEERYNLVIRPHPNYLKLGEKFKSKNFINTQIDTARLIALSDIYIAFASATIRWSIASGVPCINYDIFQYNFSDYKAVTSVENVSSKDEFKKAISLFLDENYLEILREKGALEKQNWGLLDGQSGARIIKLVKELLAVK